MTELQEMRKYRSERDDRSVAKLADMSNEEMTMTSREISTLTEKNHGHVKRDIEEMLTQLDIKIDQSIISTHYKDRMNREQTEYKLNKELTLVLVSGYSTKLRHAIVKRWQELENQTPQLPTNYLEALEALLNTEKERKQLAYEHQQLEQKIL
ncbi:MAG: Rha family transcriptional regulator, partial [Caldisericia bacterium]|nr:Rha family transcriptional regulator [Caldisericia bacterium]